MAAVAVRKACSRCGAPATAGTRCDRHPLTPRGHAHRVAVRQTLAEERVCWICGDPARAGDPLTGDHVVPRDLGGQDVRSNYRAAHRSCNSRRGNGGAR